MKKNDEAPRITLLELAQQILALPPEQQAQEAYYHTTDDRGYTMFQSVFGIETDHRGEAVIEGIDEYS